MVRGTSCELSVLVDDTPLPEHVAPDGTSWVAIPFNAKSTRMSEPEEASLLRVVYPLTVAA